MKIITDILNNNIEFDKKNTITLGKFDGVHLGHQRLFSIMHELNEGQLIAFTFDLSIRKTLQSKPVKYLFNRAEKISRLEEQGVDILIECPFTEELRTMEAEDFVKDILVDKLNVGAVVIGEDFCFGHERRGNAQLLKKMADECGFKFVKVQKLTDDDEEISASLIRRELEKGNIARVNRMLGINYYIEGEVTSGAKIGRMMGFPTINQTVNEDKLLPPYGVYASLVSIDGVYYRGVTNIGVKPTVTSTGLPIVETNLLDFEGDLYGRFLRTELLSFLRPEKKFSGIEELRKQIDYDKNTRKNMAT